MQAETATQDRPAARMAPLEAIRGIAAVVVVVYHGILSFAPGAIHGGSAPGSIIREFAAGLVNGGAAVSVFFVLSGFVLALPFTRTDGVRRSAVSIVKRWPRLAGMTVLACLFAWTAISLSGNAYIQAGHIAHAPWLTTHGNSPLSAHPKLTWHDALWEGAVAVFTQGDVHFDSALWTMRIELFCSIVVFLLAPVLFALRPLAMRLLVLAGGIVLAGTAFPLTYLADFLCGMGLAAMLDAGKLPRLTGMGASFLLCIALFSFGYRGDQHFLLYEPVRALLPSGDTNHYVWDVGALAIMVAVLRYQPLYGMLSRRWAIWLGVLSFPIYVVHVPVLLSLGAASFLVSVGLLGHAGGAIVAMVVTLAASITCALPFAWIDRHWCSALRSLTVGSYH
jgi:peptidoglycan/LPS O-acetylase OafA/YrhL